MTARIASSVVAILVAVIVVGQTPPSAAATPAAPDGDPTTAVLGIEAIDAPDSVASDVTDALRQRVASSKGFQLVQGKDLMEIKLVFSCSDEAPACMTQAGKSLGVAKLIFGNITKSGSDYVLRLKLLDVGRGAMENATTDTFPVRGSDASTLRALAPHWLSKLTGKGGAAPAGGTLMISSNVSGATVALDGTAVGVTSQQPVSVSDVTPGKHEIIVQKAGYESRHQQFTMGTGQALPLNLPLAALPPGAPAPAEASGAALPPMKTSETPGDEAPPSGMARPGFWIALAFTAASLGAATYFGLQVKQINNDLDGYRRFPVGSGNCNSSPTGFCDSSGKSASSPSAADRGFISQKLDEGDRDRTYQIVSLCVGGAFALAGGFLYYKCYLDKEGGSGPRTADNHGLRIFPTGTASSGGIVAEFDF